MPAHDRHAWGQQKCHRAATCGWTAWQGRAKTACSVCSSFAYLVGMSHLTSGPLIRVHASTHKHGCVPPWAACPPLTGEQQPHQENQAGGPNQHGCILCHVVSTWRLARWALSADHSCPAESAPPATKPQPLCAKTHQPLTQTVRRTAGAANRPSGRLQGPPWPLRSLHLRQPCSLGLDIPCSAHTLHTHHIPEGHECAQPCMHYARCRQAEGC